MISRISLLVASIIIVSATISGRAQTANDLWFKQFKGPPRTSSTGHDITEVVVHDGKVYVGGVFTTFAGVTFNNIGMWNGQKWNALGTGVNGTVRALAKDDSGNILVGGDFTTAGGSSANHIAMWNGTTWSQVGAGVPFKVRILVYKSGILYAAGENPGGDTVAKWDGTSWTMLGATNSAVDAMAYNSTFNTLYIGGLFSDVSGITANKLASYNGTTWSAVGTGVDNFVLGLQVVGNNLYVAGMFNNAGGNAIKGIAKWDGTTFSALPGAPDRTFEGIGLSPDGMIYAWGAGPSLSRVTKWNGSQWIITSVSINDITNFAFIDNTSYVAVGHNRFATGDASYITEGVTMVKNDSKIIPLSENLSIEPQALAVMQADLYAGGAWITLQGQDAIVHRGISKYNGANWSPVGGAGLPESYYQQTSPFVSALAVEGDQLYAGGSIRGLVQRWDGTNWNLLGTGLGDGTITSIAVKGKNVYAGGTFIRADLNYNVKNIGMWDGVQWNALGASVDGKVNAIAIAGSNVYVGGEFTKAGGIDARYLARWDGSQWHAVGNGTGINGVVRAIAVQGNNVYVAGDFTQVDGLTVNRVARWDGTFHTVGSGFNDRVNALVFGGGRLYAGGKFTLTGATAAKNIAVFNGTSWQAIGSGVEDVYPDISETKVLAAGVGVVYAGGNIRLAGGKSSSFLAAVYTDADDDLIPDVSDNCPNTANQNQANADGDQPGDVCDCQANNASVASKTWYRDADGDGLGNTLHTSISCGQPAGFVEQPGDCDDNDGTISIPVAVYADTDGDGYGDPNVSVDACFAPFGYVTDNTDCDDTKAAINPATKWYRDADGDGFGTTATVLTQCAKPTGYVLDNTDCDDSNALINPNTVWYADQDGDGFGRTSTATLPACGPFTGFVPVGGDCDDANNKIYPGAPEIPNGLDNNCDGLIEYIDHTLTFNKINDVEAGAPAFQVSGTSNVNGAAITYSSSSNRVTVSGSQVTPVSAGPAEVTMTAAKILGYRQTSKSQTFCVLPVKPSITIAGNQTENITLTSSSITGNQWFLNGTAVAGGTGASITIGPNGAGVYKVQVDVQGCKSAFSNDMPIVITGDLRNEGAETTAYPNPVSDRLYIAIPANKGSRIAIIQMDGRTSADFTSGDEVIEIDVTGYNQGMYLLRVTGSDRALIGRFVKR